MSACNCGTCQLKSTVSRGARSSLVECVRRLSWATGGPDLRYIGPDKYDLDSTRSLPPLESEGTALSLSYHCVYELPYLCTVSTPALRMHHASCCTYVHQSGSELESQISLPAAIQNRGNEEGKGGGNQVSMNLNLYHYLRTTHLLIGLHRDIFQI